MPAPMLARHEPFGTAMSSRGARLPSRATCSRQTLAPRLQGPEGEPNGAARAGGFSLHAGVEIAPNQREKLER